MLLLVRAPSSSENAGWIEQASKKDLIAFLQACGDDAALAAGSIDRGNVSKGQLKKKKAVALRKAAMLLAVAMRMPRKAMTALRPQPQQQPSQRRRQRQPQRHRHRHWQTRRRRSKQRRMLLLQQLRLRKRLRRRRTLLPP